VGLDVVEHRLAALESRQVLADPALQRGLVAAGVDLELRRDSPASRSGTNPWSAPKARNSRSSRPNLRTASGSVVLVRTLTATTSPPGARAR